MTGRRGPAPLCPSHAPRRRVGPWRRVGQTLSMQDTYAQGRGEVAPWPRRRVPWGSEPGAGGGQRMAWGRAGAPRASGRPGPGKREEEARLLRLTSPSRPRSHVRAGPPAARATAGCLWRGPWRVRRSLFSVPPPPLCSGRGPAGRWKNTEREAALAVSLASPDTGSTAASGKTCRRPFLDRGHLPPRAGGDGVCQGV